MFVALYTDFDAECERYIAAEGRELRAHKREQCVATRDWWEH